MSASTSGARLWRHGKEQFFAWLPALMMGLFALGTAWLVRQTPSFNAAAPEQPVLHEPDYWMREFSVRSFDARGQLKSELMGTEGHHFPDTDTLEVAQPRVRSFDAQGQLTVGRAERGLSNGEGTDIQLYGQARVVREAAAAANGHSAAPRLELRGEYLHAWTEERRVSSDQPVELLRGADRFTGDRFDYDEKSGIANLRGSVRGVIQARRP